MPAAERTAKPVLQVQKLAPAMRMSSGSGARLVVFGAGGSRLAMARGAVVGPGAAAPRGNRRRSASSAVAAVRADPLHGARANRRLLRHRMDHELAYFVNPATAVTASWQPLAAGSQAPQLVAQPVAQAPLPSQLLQPSHRPRMGVTPGTQIVLQVQQ